MGNYDPLSLIHGYIIVIPLREKMGNYDFLHVNLIAVAVIPLREKMGNYDIRLHKRTE